MDSINLKSVFGSSYNKMFKPDNDNSLLKGNSKSIKFNVKEESYNLNSNVNYNPIATSSI